MSTETIRRPRLRPKPVLPTRLEKLARFGRVRLLSLARRLLPLALGAVSAGRRLLRRMRYIRFTPANVLMVVGVMTLVGLLAMGATSLARKMWPAQVRQGKVVAGEKSAGGSQLAKISEAKFDYLVPPASGEWIYDPAGEVYDKTTGVVKYLVQRQGAAANINVSQQEFPVELGSRQAAKFVEFTKRYKVVSSREAGKGTAYFMPALENGQPSSGTDTAIYATDEVLMFARSNVILSYDEWVGLLASMRRR